MRKGTRSVTVSGISDPRVACRRDGRYDHGLGAPLGGLSGDRGLDKGARHAERTVKGAVVENGFEALQQQRQGEVSQRPRGGQRAIVDQTDGKHEISVEAGMDRRHGRLGDGHGAQIVVAEMPPDQPERGVGLAILAQGRSLLVVVKDQPVGVVGVAHVIDHPILPPGSRFGSLTISSDLFNPLHQISGLKT